jgi:hypothetical protein
MLAVLLVGSEPWLDVAAAAGAGAAAVWAAGAGVAEAAAPLDFAEAAGANHCWTPLWPWHAPVLLGAAV